MAIGIVNPSNGRPAPVMKQGQLHRMTGLLEPACKASNET
nr:hypothetical protein [uncultured bacterium]